MMSRILKIWALVSAACALLLVGLWATVWTPGQGVADSKADIVDLFSHPDTPTTRFERALEHLGHEKPRAFDLNGNTVYFSVNYVDQRPIEVLKRYQDEFVYQGLNHDAYVTDRAARSTQALQDMLTGGIVPTEIGREYVAMGGGLSENRAQNARQLVELGRDFASGKLAKKFRAYRHIEAFREKHARWTTVVATWSDDDFDYRKMVAGSRVRGQNADPRVPACPGCTRLQRFDDLDPAQGHVDHVFAGRRSVDETLGFYDRVLPRRGWKLAPTTRVLERARRMKLPLPAAHMRHYVRAGQEMTVVVYPGDDGLTMAHLTLSDG